MTVHTTRVTVPSQDIQLGRALTTAPDVRVDFDRFVPLGELVAPYFRVRTGDVGAFERDALATEAVASIERLSDENDTYLYRVEWDLTADPFIDGLRSHAIVVERASGTDRTWQFRLSAHARQTLSSFDDHLSANDIASTVEAVWQQEPRSQGPYGLTPKQRQAVELALTRGYYAVPKEANLSELAADIGISRQSYSRRLDRGLQKILAETLST